MHLGLPEKLKQIHIICLDRYEKMLFFLFGIIKKHIFAKCDCRLNHSRLSSVAKSHIRYPEYDI